MSAATQEAPAKNGRLKPASRTQSVMAPAFPQVNLLPPEVKAARGLARVKRWLLAVVVLAVLGVAGLMVLAVLAQQGADEELALVQADTEDLLRQQQQYAEVPLVLAELDRARLAREVAMSTEVRWRTYLRAVAETTGDNVRIENLRFHGTTVVDPPVPPTDALSAQSVGSVTFTAQSLTVPDTTAWVVRLQAVPGFQDAWFSQATLTEVDGVVHYNVTATVQINEQAYSGRFAPDATAEEGQ